MIKKNAKKPKLAAPVRPGILPRGSDTVDAILQSAMNVLVEQGATAFTMRRIASECGLPVGNLSRHFPKKEMLLQVLLEELLTPSENDLRKQISDTGIPADEGLARLIEGCLDEIQTKKITRLSTECWAMANHNEFVAERVELVYRHMHGLISVFVSELNPALSPQEVEIVSVYISASTEGTTMLAGYGKPWSGMMPQIRGIAVKCLVSLVKTITPAEVQGLVRRE